MIKEIFTHNDEEFEIRASSDDTGTLVRAFKEDKHANGYFYSVDHTVAVGFKQKFGDPIQHLVDTAKRDIIEGVWEKYVDVVESSKTTK